METPIKIQIVKSLSNLKPSRIIAVKKDAELDFSLYITDINGVPYPIKNNVAVAGVDSIINTDGTLNVVGSSNIVINIDSTLLATINSALQSGANISELVNDEGYITAVDLPIKTSDLVNDGSDNTSTYVENDELALVATSNSFLDLDDIPTTFTPSSHTHVEADITDLDKYTQLEVNNFLADKENLSNKKTDVDANKTSNIFYASVKAIYDWGVGLFQPILISGTNIKTINGNSLLGAGDLIVAGGGDDTFVLSFPRLAITGNATNVFFASFINTSSVLFNSSTAISDHTLLTTINFASTRLFVIPQNCIIDKIIINANVNFELSIWKADSMPSPTTGKTEVFYEVSSGSRIANYNVASPTLTQGNILVPMIKTLGVTTTYYGDFFITFKTI